MFENNLIAGSAGQATGFYPYAIDQSLRFNDDDSAYLERTPATAGNRKTWTWSGWVKRGNLGSFQGIATVGDASDQTRIAISPNDNLFIFSRSSGVLNLSVSTDSAFRDCSAWYHVVINVDTTQASQANRLKIYTNGVETSYSGSTLLGLNVDTFFNTTLEHRISRYEGTNDFYFDGYMAEINFIDGQALDPTSFGEFKSGVWVAKEYTGTYGTNGFYLPFENGLGNDESGNGNDWTPNNLAATDIVLDSPTNNFAVCNVNDPITAMTFTEGNLIWDTGSTSNRGACRSTLGFNPDSELIYAEFYIVSQSSDNRYRLGVISGKVLNEVTIGGQPWGNDNSQTFENIADVVYRGNDGAVILEGNSQSYGVSSTAGDVVQIAVGHGAVWFGKNGTWMNGANNSEIASANTSNAATTGLSGLFWITSGEGSGAHTAKVATNFGQDSSFAGNETAQGNTDENGIGDFYYTPPAGFLALCTANLPEPAISPADDASPSDYFNTVLYSGNLSNPRSITGLGFQPDWVWVKQRSSNGGGATFHQIYDSVRGVQKLLRSNTTDAELANPSNGGVESFDSDGFTIEGSSASLNMNDTGETYVAWNWKAGGAGVTNTDGSITSTVSASTESGFSIAGYTGDGTSGTRTIGCGLSQKPEMVILKNRTEDGVSDTWFVYHTSLGSSSPSPYLTLYNTDAVATSGVFVDTAFSDNSGDALFAVSGGYDGVNKSGTTYIAYCFHSVEGYSKFGSYTGNGSTDGPFVYTGFRPAFVIVKRTDSSGFSWMMHDTARMPYNQIDSLLVANSNAAENTNNSIDMDIVSNGFKFRGDNTNTNASGGTYIYMAFAENPFKFSNAR